MATKEAATTSDVMRMIDVFIGFDSWFGSRQVTLIMNAPPGYGVNPYFCARHPQPAGRPLAMTAVTAILLSITY